VSRRPNGVTEPRCAFTLFIPVVATLLASAPPIAAAEDAALLTRMLRESRSAHVRASAAAVIGRRKDQEKRPELEGALADQHPVVRAAAANALGQIGSPASLPPLNEAAADQVKTVAVEARQAIHTIEAHTPVSREAPTHGDVSDPSKARFGLSLGEMRNQSDYQRGEVLRSLSGAVERHLRGFREVAVFPGKQTEHVQAAQARGLPVYRLNAAVTSLSATLIDSQLWVHCEVLLLVMDEPTGLLRTVLKGAARGVEVPSGDPAAQRLAISRRVVDGAVRSALRNADAALGDALRLPRPAAVTTAPVAPVPVAPVPTTQPQRL
ncbi:MAG: HEAT repeat domain-containing protein, partial [Polyangiales bacterium]